MKHNSNVNSNLRQTKIKIKGKEERTSCPSPNGQAFCLPTDELNLIFDLLWSKIILSSSKAWRRPTLVNSTIYAPFESSPFPYIGWNRLGFFYWPSAIVWSVPQVGHGAFCLEFLNSCTRMLHRCGRFH